MEEEAGDTGLASEPDDQPKGITVVVHKSKDTDLKLPAGVRIVSILYFVYGCLAIITQSIIAASHGPGIMEGFVAAVLYFATGSVGFLALKQPTQCKASAFLVLNLVSCVWSQVALVFGGVVLFSALTAAVEIIWAVAATITSVTASALSCRGLCCGRSAVSLDRLKGRALAIISATQILVGLIFMVCFPLNVVLVGTFSIFEEIWCGLFFVLIGIFGVLTARRATVSWLTAFVSLSVFGALFTVVVLVTTAIKTAHNGDHRHYEIERLGNDLDFFMNDALYNCTERQLWAERDFNGTLYQLPENFTENVAACEEERAAHIKADQAELAAVIAGAGQENLNLAILALQLALVFVEVGIILASIVLACQPLCGGGAAAVDSTAYYIPQQDLQSGVVHVTKGSSNTRDRFEDEGASGKQYSRLE